LFAVPKCHPAITLGFVNPSLSYPFFKTWSDGYKAAAKFYKVSLHEDDINFNWDQTVPQFQALLPFHPAVVGTLTTAGDALLRAANTANVKVLPIDLPIKGTYFMGVPNQKAGRLGGDILAKAAATKLKGPWKGKQLLYVGLDNPTCDPCHQRVVAGAAAAAKIVSLPGSNVTQLNVTVTGDSSNGRGVVTDFLTAHPNSVMIMLGLNDEVADGAFQAVRAANRQGDVLLFSLGGDDLGRANLRKDTSGFYLGALDFNPFREAWNWVEAAIAITMNKRFPNYNVDRIITKANVDKLFPKDKASG
jgi:ABC-type sugar transport system substrate-binding protein